MDVRIIVIGGQVQIFVDGQGVSYDDASAATKQVLAAIGPQLAALGLPIQQTSAIEQHKDAGVTHAHVVEHHHH